MKVKQIIKEEFDSRLSLMVLAYTLGQLGLKQASEITDGDINSMQGNPVMTKEFCQSLARTARRIGKECDFASDIVPFILDEFAYMKEKEDDDE